MASGNGKVLEESNRACVGGRVQVELARRVEPTRENYRLKNVASGRLGGMLGLISDISSKRQSKTRTNEMLKSLYVQRPARFNTYHHTHWNIRDPVRSPLVKPRPPHPLCALNGLDQAED
ncbi:hypothetical protein GGTG_06995 [Gaeumannomyces tritici R3-111a-1]|uniref:Uncharacterized protein n=1 Tax=Gaeumannomyces tritici (strain R3-111a-1) TaxID=644352 RepID=J3P0E8_GAET3|nr:hypothetical protein GGTG_06995 [Gaeumannomyces tritici R3-111a-1]EJT77081.1 hypothetical protein GGTG_06995 [Gaeumannomyces tritici R3-111a-1]